MKLTNFTGKKVTATLTHLDANNKEAHFVIGDAHASYKFEGEPVKAKLLTKVTIEEGGLVTVKGIVEKAKDAVQKKSGSTGNGSAFNKQY